MIFIINNDSAEDYYYLEIKDCTTGGLWLRNPATANANIASVLANNGGVPVGNAVDPYDASILSDLVTSGKEMSVNRGQNNFNIVSYGIIPKGTTGFTLDLNDKGDNDTIQIFKRDGTHILGTTLDKWTKPGEQQIVPSDFITEANGFLPNASYNDNNINGIGGNLTIDYSDPMNFPIQNFNIDGMNIGYTSDADVAREMTLFVRSQILTQSAVAMLGQANSFPHMLSSLLMG